MEQLEREEPAVYRFDGFELDVATSLLRYRNQPIAVGPRVVQTLVALVERAGAIVPKDQLLEIVWPDGYVEEANLSQNVYVLRKLMRARGASCRIETVPRRGYRLIAKVTFGHQAEQRRLMRRYALRWPASIFAAAMLLAVAAASSHSQSNFGRSLSTEGARSYLLGRYYWNLRTPDGLMKSVRYFNAVVRTDPQNALGYSGLADAYSMIEDYSRAPMADRHVVRRARENALHALKLDPDSAEARTSYAMVLDLFEHRAAQSDAEFKRAITLKPNYALAHEWYGTSLLMRGRIAQSRSELETALSLDPTATATNAWVGVEAYFDRRYRDAIRYMRDALDLNGGHVDSVMMLGLAQEQIHDYAGAAATFERLARFPHHRADAQILLAEMYARLGKVRDAFAALRQARRLPDEISPDQIALVYVALGNRDLALSYMRHAAPKNEQMWYALDPRWDSVRGDARFRRWVKAG
ncbi:MAG: winged helix-turn-helix domain-containing protein [Candidatus Eremiobacteraeota bacterium]|nr:winged helix-turn-helix domain-containing protein [Candidatus Eremiobacteraeota bacterium]